ncbi:MAG: hypothetical protein P9X26_00475 [Candidatus Stygibacter frigidus]|nr:hypothetical protein [Candidatus Stygibacter frigidus]
MKRILLATLLVFLIIFFVSGCDDRNPTSPNISLIISTDLDTLHIGSSINSCNISAKITRDGEDIEGAQVNFSTNFGEIIENVNSNIYGVAESTFWYDGNETGVATIRASYKGAQDQLNIHIVNSISLIISTDLDTLHIGSSINSCNISAKITKDGEDIEGAQVNFSTNMGSILESGISNIYGVAESTFLYEGNEIGVATIHASYSGADDELQIQIVDDLSFRLEIWAAPDTIYLDSGDYSTDVFASLTDYDGNPVSDAIIHFEVSSGFIPLSSITNINGQVEVPYIFTGDEEEAVELTATYQELSIITYIYVIVPQLVLTAWADPDTVYQGTSVNYSEIYAQLITEFGSPISGVQITFTTSIGDILSHVSTNSDGIANATFWYSERPDITAMITASYQGFTANTSVTILEDQLEIVALEADPLIIYADNNPETFSTISARVYDSAGSPVEDAIVGFQTNLGYMAFETAQTNSSGWATNMLHDNGVSGLAAIDITCDNDHSQIDVQINDE